MGIAFQKPVLVGRERERRLLLAALDRAAGGQGTLVLLSGEAGIGKTTLVDDLASRAGEDGALVLSGGGYDLTTTPPYGPWVEVLRSYQHHAELPSLPIPLQAGGGLRGIDSQTALFELTGTFLADVAAVRPLVILLEDFHWADAASLDLLRYLALQRSSRHIGAVEKWALCNLSSAWYATMNGYAQGPTLDQTQCNTLAGLVGGSGGFKSCWFLTGWCWMLQI